MEENRVKVLRRVICQAVCFLLVLCVTAAASAETSLAGRVLAEINLARTEPQNYAGFLREFRRQFEGKNYRMPCSRTFVRTSEGGKAVDEAIRFLSRQRPLSRFAWSAGLAAAAAELVADEGETGAIGHMGSQSGGMRERIERHGTWEGQIGENIGYGPGEARLIVMQLIVDDGVPDRGHRKNLFTRAFGVAGVACGSHPRFGNMCVIDFAGGFSP